MSLWSGSASCDIPITGLLFGEAANRTRSHLLDNKLVGNKVIRFVLQPNRGDVKCPSVYIFLLVFPLRRL